jgi:hypothetical protein
VPNPGPQVTGTFDGGLLGASGVYPQLEVRMCPRGITTLCPASGAGSFKSFNAFTADPITLQQAGNYQLLWNKNPLVSGNTYRAWVLVHTGANADPISLGFGDVRVVGNSQAAKQVDGAETTQRAEGRSDRAAHGRAAPESRSAPDIPLHTFRQLPTATRYLPHASCPHHGNTDAAMRSAT